VSAEVEPWTGREGGGDGKRSCEGKTGALRARVYLFAVLFLFFWSTSVCVGEMLKRPRVLHLSCLTLLPLFHNS
jgi:hypothetical protein